MDTENPASESPSPPHEAIDMPPEGHKEKLKKYKLEKGAEALLRVTLRNQMDLSDMADRKASLLISINTLVLSVIGSLLYTKFDKNPELVAPTVVLAAVCLSVIILAILSTRPKISGGTFTNKQVKAKSVNLLFFGNFYKMSLDEYQWATDEMLHDREYMFEAITRDIHSLGIVVAKKYRFLNLAYNMFMYGLIVAVLAFGLSYLITDRIMQ